MPRGRNLMVEPQGLDDSPATVSAPRQAAPPVAGNKPLRTPDEWGMMAIKVQKKIQMVTQPDGRQVRKVILECPELDDSVFMERNDDYVETDSNGQETYISRPVRRQFIQKKNVQYLMEKDAWTKVEPQPDWRIFALRD